MKWIRTTTDMMSDTRIGKIARMCDIPRPYAMGLVIAILHQLPGHAIDGNLSAVEDEDLESWADWRGEPGRFAVAFRAQMCETSGVVRSWEKHNGAAIREYLRKRAPNNSAPFPKSGAENPETGARIPRPRVRNEYEYEYETTTNTKGPDLVLAPPPPPVPPSAVASAPPKKRRAPDPPAPQFPGFTTEEATAMHGAWEARVGAISYPRFRSALGPMFRTVESERSPEAPTNAELRTGFDLYLSVAPSGRSAPWVGPEDAGKRLAALALLARRHADDPVARVEGAERIIHGHNSRSG